MAQKKIIVLGDVMIDVNYISYSKPDRTAPESSSVGVHKVNKISHVLGGAANVAAGFAKLGMYVYLFGVVGEDDFYSTIIQNEISTINKNGECIADYLSTVKMRPTTQKHRHFLNDVLTTRFDIENTGPIDFADSVKMEIKRLIDKQGIDAIVFSDYNKGYLTPDLCRYVIEYANNQGIYTFVDPKTKDCQKYNRCFCFKPNSIEAAAISNVQLIDNHIFNKRNLIQNIAKNIHKVVNSNYYLITDGANGLFLCSQPIDTNQPEFHIYHCKHTEAIDVKDVTGAGDVVMVAFVVTFLEKIDICFSAKVANIIGGKSVRVLGNYQITRDILQQTIDTLKTKNDLITQTSESTMATAAQIRTTASENGQTIVFTNGCFDILHSAHLRLLNYAKTRGDILVVGLNTDNSINRIKGNTRPINSQDERVAILSELRGIVDYVVLFDEDTPYNLIQILCPDVIVKGGDYSAENVIGREFAKRVDIFPYENGKSTTNVIKLITETK